MGNIKSKIFANTPDSCIFSDKTKLAFNDDGTIDFIDAAGNATVDVNSILFIKEPKLIYTHGVVYDCRTLNPQGTLSLGKDNKLTLNHDTEFVEDPKKGLQIRNDASISSGLKIENVTIDSQTVRHLSVKTSRTITADTNGIYLTHATSSLVGGLKDGEGYIKNYPNGDTFPLGSSPKLYTPYVKLNLSDDKESDYETARVEIPYAKRYTDQTSKEYAYLGGLITSEDYTNLYDYANYPLASFKTDITNEINIALSAALQYKGVLFAPHTGSVPTPSNPSKGDLYVISVEGTDPEGYVSGINNNNPVFSGDMIIYNGTGWDYVPMSKGTVNYVGSSPYNIQGQIAIFDDKGTKIKEGGYSISDLMSSIITSARTANTYYSCSNGKTYYNTMVTNSVYNGGDFSNTFCKDIYLSIDSYGNHTYNMQNLSTIHLPNQIYCNNSDGAVLWNTKGSIGLVSNEDEVFLQSVGTKGYNNTLVVSDDLKFNQCKIWHDGNTYINGQTITIGSNSVTVPTNYLTASDLSDYVTSSTLNSYYTSSEVDTLLASCLTSSDVSVNSGYLSLDYGTSYNLGTIGGKSIKITMPQAPSSSSDVYVIKNSGPNVYLSSYTDYKMVFVYAPDGCKVHGNIYTNSGSLVTDYTSNGTGSVWGYIKLNDYGTIYWKEF